LVAAHFVAIAGTAWHHFAMRQRRYIQVRRSLLTLIIAAAALVTATRTAQAGFSAELVDIVPEGANLRYNYRLIFDTLLGHQRLDAGNGILAPGVMGSQDFITIYDVDEPAHILDVTAGPGFTFQLQGVGVDHPRVIPNDDSLLLNVTYRYVGPPTTVVDGTAFTGFSILGIYEDLSFVPPRIDEYGSQWTDSFGLEAGRKIAALGPVLVPPEYIPEPRTWLLLALACAGVATIRRRWGRRQGRASRWS
jgi:hypothetical protein